MRTRDQARYSTASFDDIDEYREEDCNIDGGVVLQLERGALQIDFEEIAFTDLRVRRFRSSRALSMEAYFPSGWTSFILCPDQSVGETNWCGVPVVANTLAVMSSGREHHYRIPSNWVDIEIAVANDVLMDRNVFPETLFERFMAPERSHIRLPNPYAAKLNKYLTSLVTDSGAKTAIEIDWPLHRALRNAILDELATAIEVGLKNEAEMQQDTYQRYALVRRVERYVTRNVSQLQGSKSIYTELNLNRRRVERAFNQVLGISPNQYVIQARLQAARRFLLKDSTDAPVTEAAVRFGFASSSEFSRHYKQTYGENPTDTLNNRV